MSDNSPPVAHPMASKGKGLRCGVVAMSGAGSELLAAVTAAASEVGATIAVGGWSSSARSLSGTVRSAWARLVCPVVASCVGSAVHCGSQVTRRVGRVSDRAGMSSKLATLRHHIKCRQAAEARPSSVAATKARSITAALLSTRSKRPDVETSINNGDMSASLHSSLLDELHQALELFFRKVGVGSL